MGGLFSKLFASIAGNKEVRVLILGLDNAGKTTILYKLQMGEVVTTVPTIGFNVETVQYKSLRLQVWDLGGQTSIRPYWRCYYQNTNAIIYVVDSADGERMGLCKNELITMLEEEELKGAALIIFANKQDLPGAIQARHSTARRAPRACQACAVRVRCAAILCGAGGRDRREARAAHAQGQTVVDLQHVGSHGRRAVRGPRLARRHAQGRKMTRACSPRRAAALRARQLRIHWRVLTCNVGRNRAVHGMSDDACGGTLLRTRFECALRERGHLAPPLAVLGGG